MPAWLVALVPIVALRNEKGSYSLPPKHLLPFSIVALRNEKGSYSPSYIQPIRRRIVALRNEKGSYSHHTA